ncbi:hypothetical protein [Cytobacillus horneckiae]|uniref:hypothetical protein n=1 Tax=Cytobacillus horneckiae TaxID=549687 RepID=UPI003D9A413B
MDKSLRVVGVISVLSKTNRKNPLTLHFTVNRYRKDYPEVVRQLERKGQLRSYEDSLFRSCFKKW